MLWYHSSRSPGGQPPVRRPVEVGRVDVGRQALLEAVQLIGADEVHLAGERRLVAGGAQHVGDRGRAGGQLRRRCRRRRSTTACGRRAARSATGRTAARRSRRSRRRRPRAPAPSGAARARRRCRRPAGARPPAGRPSRAGCSGAVAHRCRQRLVQCGEQRARPLVAALAAQLGRDVREAGAQRRPAAVGGARRRRCGRRRRARGRARSACRRARSRSGPKRRGRPVSGSSPTPTARRPSASVAGVSRAARRRAGRRASPWPGRSRRRRGGDAEREHARIVPERGAGRAARARTRARAADPARPC